MRQLPRNGGWLEVVCGPMFSGKSEELIRRVRRAEIAGQRIRVFNPRIDTRHGEGQVVSHGGLRREAVSVGSAAEVLGSSRGLEVVGIDEAQFFDDGLPEVAERLVAAGVRVIVSGLDQDYRGEPFGSIPALLARAEFVDKLQAVCHSCGGAATMTQRLIDGEPAPFSGATVVIGGVDRYEARCRVCFEVGADAKAAPALFPVADAVRHLGVVR